MLCKKCNKEFSDGINICPHCGEKTEYIRCPKCWTKLDSNAKECTKCGCDIEKTVNQNAQRALEKQETFIDKAKKVPLWIKIVLPVIVVALIAGVIINFAISGNKAEVNAAKLAAEYAQEMDYRVEEISTMATIYETEVYAKDWLMQQAAAKELRKVYADEIKAIKEERESVEYEYKKITGQGDEDISALAKDVFECYRECYSYVIRENGKSPNYLKNYKKLLAEYRSASKKLVEKTQKVLK